MIADEILNGMYPKSGCQTVRRISGNVVLQYTAIIWIGYLFNAASIVLTRATINDMGIAIIPIIARANKKSLSVVLPK